MVEQQVSYLERYGARIMWDKGLENAQYKN